MIARWCHTTWKTNPRDSNFSQLRAQEGAECPSRCFPCTQIPACVYTPGRGSAAVWKPSPQNCLPLSPIATALIGPTSPPITPGQYGIPALGSRPQIPGLIFSTGKKPEDADPCLCGVGISPAWNPSNSDTSVCCWELGSVGSWQHPDDYADS